jgi:hypothetical protein
MSVILTSGGPRTSEDVLSCAVVSGHFIPARFSMTCGATAVGQNVSVNIL